MFSKFCFGASSSSLSARFQLGWTRALGFQFGTRLFSDENAASKRPYAGSNHISNKSPEEKVPHRGLHQFFLPRMATEKNSNDFTRKRFQVYKKCKDSLSNPNNVGEDEDDFSELGSPVTETGNATLEQMKDTNRLNLEPLRKLLGVERIRAAPSMRPFPDKKNPDMMIHLKTDKFFSDDHFSSGATTKNEREKNSIIIDKVPSALCPFHLRDAASEYGDILHVHMTTGENGFKSCHIDFKSKESKERAVAARWISVKSYRLPIQSLSLPGSTAVRIENISNETTEAAIHSLCMSFGPVESLSREKNGAVDVIFNVEDSALMPNILKKLNDVVMDDCQWSAQLLSWDSPNTINTSDDQGSVGSLISNHIQEIRKQLQEKMIDLEDLEELHLAIEHLRDSPANHQ
ncbi:uncharacterized protein LOC18445104 [Amborella trichopoda]|uniref:RRM domain-containing protein n=1 Tax=Amborella trichopoda TaxID=13333 RepID=U5D8R3_AMBTC|nr:uncharacterized protein LOC18445104 [Amborella trichopoda]ERN16778.1 hypothetical protein AMTR_s00057p00072880 [Amborella trichopoda]|eukprot:XP_006855311.1 uncharacterized protein LOC18445104 [Amborella trichopoda]